MSFVREHSRAFLRYPPNPFDDRVYEVRRSGGSSSRWTSEHVSTGTCARVCMSYRCVLFFEPFRVHGHDHVKIVYFILYILAIRRDMYSVVWSTWRLITIVRSISAAVPFLNSVVRPTVHHIIIYCFYSHKIRRIARGVFVLQIGANVYKCVLGTRAHNERRLSSDSLHTDRSL